MVSMSCFYGYWIVEVHINCWWALLLMLILSNHFLNINVFLNYQEFICEKGIGFVRIDGNTLATDRQSAVRSFQLSTEVRISCTIISKIFAPAFFLDVPINLTTCK